MNTNNRPHPSVTDERSLGDLFADLSKKANLLVRQEIHLAKVELKHTATKAGKEVALIIAGTFLGNAALLSLVAALILGLASLMDVWLAALLVGVVLAAVAAALAGKGIQALRDMNPVPERTITTLEEDKEWLKQQVS
jgi:hypothetical protein